MLQTPTEQSCASSFRPMLRYRVLAWADVFAFPAHRFSGTNFRVMGFDTSTTSDAEKPRTKWFRAQDVALFSRR